MSKQATEDKKTTEVKTPQVKKVRNRNDYKVELLIDGNVVVFSPRKTVAVPFNFDIPANIGLYTI